MFQKLRGIRGTGLWPDECNNPIRTIDAEDNKDISVVPANLLSQDLFQTKIQVACESVQSVIIINFSSTGQARPIPDKDSGRL